MAYDRLSQLDVFRLTDKASPGLVIRIRRPGLDAQLLIEEAMPVLRRHSGPTLGLPEMRAMRKLARAFAESVSDWTFVDSGDPAPVSAKTLGRYDPMFILELVRAWLDAINRPVSVKKPEPEAVPLPEPEVDEWEVKIASLPVQAAPKEVSASA